MINPADSDAVGNAIKMANQQKVPVITLDRGASSGMVATHIASDNVAGGKMAGEYIIELLDGSGTVVELEGIPEHPQPGIEVKDSTWPWKAAE